MSKLTSSAAEIRLAPSVTEIRNALDVLFEPSQTIELRAFGTKHGTCVGFYRDRDKMAADAVKISENASTPAVFWTLQEINPELFDHAPDQFQRRVGQGTATGDADVARYRWLLIDCDPLRNPAKISSTDAEKADALNVAETVREYFSTINIWDGYASILADSGNGYHVLLRIDLDTSAGSKTLYSRVLQSLNQQFSTGDATCGTKIDVSVFNPSRICKIYGTVVRKGSGTSERPHRMAHLVDVPKDLPVVPREVLEQIAATAPSSAPAGPSTTAISSKEIEKRATTMEKFLAEAKVHHRPRMEYDGGGCKWQLQACPFNPEHKAPDSYVFVKADCAMGFHCSHNSCVENKWDQFRPKAEAIIGHRFKFVENPVEVSVRVESADVEEYEPTSTIVSNYPEMGNDLISQWARLATDGTGIPFGHVRENLKVVLAFCLSDAIRYPGHESLYPRGWHFNIGDAESGKTTALLFVLDRWRSVMMDLAIRIDKLSSYGSLQFLTKGFEDHPRMFLYVTEGNTLANANEHIAAIFGGLSDLYDQSIISAGSFKNKSASCVTAQGSSIICFTPEDYLKALEGKGVIGGGVLPRWTLSESKKIAVTGDWATPPEVELRDLQNRMMERFNDVHVIETAEAKIIREALKEEMDRPEAGRHGKRLIEHFKRECLLAAVFAPASGLNKNVGVITREIGEWAAQWVRYQLHLRIALWPIDAGSDVERMCSLIRALLQRANPKAVSLKQLKDACHVYRQGSGGIEAFGRAYRAMVMNEEMRKIGKNSRGKDLFGLVID